MPGAEESGKHAHRRVLVLAPGPLGERLSGPEIRATRLAAALAREHDVTLMAPGASGGEAYGARLLPFSRRRLLGEARHHDAVLAATVPPFALALRQQLGFAAISDQYDPVELEMGTLGAGAARASATARASRRLQLRQADLVLCAGMRQRERLGAELDDLGLARPGLLEVPFGIDDAPAAPRARPLRERFPQISAEDRVVLWWGSLWRWLDAETAIGAFSLLAAERPDLKLVFTSGPAPNQSVERHSAAAGARRLAERLGLLGRTVLFLDEWVPYERRGDFLQEADLGLTLHRNTEEAPLAARARYMDYLWAGLPCVLGQGDETAHRFAAAGFARLVEPGSPRAVADAVLAMLERRALSDARATAPALAEELRWRRVAAPLLEAIPGLGPARPGGARETQLRPMASYYLHRLRDRAPAPLRALSQGR